MVILAGSHPGTTSEIIQATPLVMLDLMIMGLEVEKFTEATFHSAAQLIISGRACLFNFILSRRSCGSKKVTLKLMKECDKAHSDRKTISTHWE